MRRLPADRRPALRAWLPVLANFLPVRRTATLVFLLLRRGVDAADWNAFFALSLVAAREPSADPMVSATATNAVSVFDSLVSIFSPSESVDLAIRLRQKIDETRIYRPNLRRPDRHPTRTMSKLVPTVPRPPPNGSCKLHSPFLSSARANENPIPLSRSVVSLWHAIRFQKQGPYAIPLGRVGEEYVDESRTTLLARPL